MKSTEVQNPRRMKVVEYPGLLERRKCGWIAFGLESTKHGSRQVQPTSGVRVRSRTDHRRVVKARARG